MLTSVHESCLAYGYDHPRYGGIPDSGICAFYALSRLQVDKPGTLFCIFASPIYRCAVAIRIVRGAGDLRIVELPPSSRFGGFQAPIVTVGVLAKVTSRARWRERQSDHATVASSSSNATEMGTCARRMH